MNLYCVVMVGILKEYCNKQYIIIAEFIIMRLLFYHLIQNVVYSVDSVYYDTVGK